MCLCACLCLGGVPELDYAAGLLFQLEKSAAFVIRRPLMGRIGAALLLKAQSVSLIQYAFFVQFTELPSVQDQATHTRTHTHTQVSGNSQ